MRGGSKDSLPLYREVWESLPAIARELIEKTLESHKRQMAGYNSLHSRIERLEKKLAAAETEKTAAQTELKRVQRQLDETQRKLEETQRELLIALRLSKRQAAPFAKGEPKEHPRKPGRKRGHAPAYRPVPSEVDETVELTLDRCPHCCAFVRGDHVEEQYVEDIPPIRPFVRRFLIHSGYCRRCRRRVRPRHPEQVSTAVGAAQVHLGPRAIALAADLKHRLAVPFRKVADIYGRHFGLKVTHGALVQATARLARRLEPVHHGIVQQLRASSVAHVDETGWRIGGRSAWLWVFTNRDLTVYVIRRSRGQDVVRETLGERFGGVMVTDFLATYDPLPYRKGKCLGHLIRELSDLLEIKKGYARRFLRKARDLFRRVLRLKRKRGTMPARNYMGQATRVEVDLNRLIDGQYSDDDNRRLAARLRKQREHVLTCLYHEDVDPTNNHAERQIRPAVIVRKISACNRSPLGARTHEVLTTVIVTCGQQGASFDALAQHALAIDADPRMAVRLRAPEQPPLEPSAGTRPSHWTEEGRRLRSLASMRSPP